MSEDYRVQTFAEDETVEVVVGVAMDIAPQHHTENLAGQLNKGQRRLAELIGDELVGRPGVWRIERSGRAAEHLEWTDNLLSFRKFIRYNEWANLVKVSE